MSPSRFASFAKFLIGVLLLQGATVMLVYTASKTDLAQTWPLFGALGVTLGAVIALWLSAVSEHARKEALSKAEASFSRQREKIRVRAEQDKTKEIKNAQRQIQRETQRSKTGSNIKTGIVIGGAASAGLLLLLTQMVTLGLLTLTTAGGAALGYGIRSRQERLGLGVGKRFGREEKQVGAIDAEPVPKAVKAPRVRAVAAPKEG
jgi:hypothetical protein